VRKISLWTARIVPILLCILLFIPGLLSPLGYTDTFFAEIGGPQSVLTMLMNPNGVRSVCDPVKSGYNYIVSIYTNEHVGQTAMLSDIMPIICIIMFISYFVMAAGTILTYFDKKDTVQNTGSKIVKIGGFFSLGVTLASVLINYSSQYRNTDNTVIQSAVEYGLVRAFPLGTILALALCVIGIVACMIFNYINTQSVRAAMKILQSVRPVENPAIRATKSVVNYIIAILVALIFLVPFYITVVNSVRELQAKPVISWPSPPHFENYVYAINRIPFADYAISSLMIIVLSVGLGVIVNYIYAYGFARMKAPGKDFLFSVVITMMMVPTIATQIPQYMVFVKLGTANTYWIWFILGIAGKPTYIFLYRQFLQQLPMAFEESAKIDGATLPRTIFSIIVPNTAPVIATVFMLEFLYSWADLTLPYLYLSMDMWPLSAALQGRNYVFPNTSAVLEPMQMAMCIMFIIPSIVAYTFGQSYLREGMVTSGLKG